MPVTVQPDVVAAVRSFLLQDADVASLSGGRVFGEAIPDGAIAAMPTSSVLIKTAGGPGDAGRIPWSRTRLDIPCYAATFELAAKLELAVYQALKQTAHVIVGGVKIFDAIILTGPIAVRDPETGWRFRFRTYLVSMHETVQT